MISFTKRLFIFSILPLFLLFLTLSFAKPAYAALCGTAGHPAGGSVCSAPSCNGTGPTTLGCQMKTWHNNAGNCDCGWTGTSASGCTPADCGKSGASGGATCGDSATPGGKCMTADACTALPGNNEGTGGSCLTAPNTVCCVPAGGGTPGGGSTPPANTYPPPIICIANNGYCLPDKGYKSDELPCCSLEYTCQGTYGEGHTDWTCLPKPGVTFSSNCSGSSCETAVGTITYNSTNPIGGLVTTLFSVLLGLSGGLAVLLIIYSGYILMSSQGNPEKVQQAKEQLTAAIVGLLFVIFSLVILQSIGVNILNLPGFSGV